MAKFVSWKKMKLHCWCESKSYLGEWKFLEARISHDKSEKNSYEVVVKTRMGVIYAVINIVRVVKQTLIHI
mgnify:FL=1